MAKIINEFRKVEVTCSRKKADVQFELLGLCSDLLLEARYPIAVSGTAIDRISTAIDRIIKQLQSTRNNKLRKTVKEVKRKVTKV